MCAVPSAPGAARVRVWQVMSRGRDPSQGRPPPESVHVAYPLDTQYAPPGDELERWLADLWASVLDLDSVGIDDQFLDLGGGLPRRHAHRVAGAGHVEPGTLTGRDPRSGHGGADGRRGA